MSKNKPTEKSQETIEQEAINQSGIQLAELEAEIKLGRHEIDLTELLPKDDHSCDVEDADGSISKRVYVYFPNEDNELQVSKRRAKLLSAVLRDKDTMTEAQVMDKLTEMGMWSPAMEEREKAFIDDIGECTKKILILKNKETIDEEAIDKERERRRDIETNRRELTKHRDTWLQAASDRYVNEEVNMFKLTLCVKKPDGTPYWESFDAYQNDENRHLVMFIKNKAWYYWHGYNESLLREALEDLV